MVIRMDGKMEDNLRPTSESLSKAMGDQDKPIKSIDIQKESLNTLHKAKTSLSCSKEDTSLKSKEEVLEKIHDPQSLEKVSSVFNVENDNVEKGQQLEEEKHSAVSSISQIKSTIEPTPKQPARNNSYHEPSSNVSPERKNRINSAASSLNQIDKVTKKPSGIFSLSEETTIVSSIFSVNGSPSRKLYRKKDLPPNNVFPASEKLVNKEDPHGSVDTVLTKDKIKERLCHNSYNDLKRPSSSIRNPLTGTGLSSNDEYKCKTTTRKDGNPLLGLGYSPETTPSTHRIPPGGYSHKLW